MKTCEECHGTGNWTGVSGDDEYTQQDDCYVCEGAGVVVDLDPMDEPRLPDKWGYDYAERRFFSPMMKRSLLIALLPFAFLMLAAIVVIVVSA